MTGGLGNQMFIYALYLQMKKRFPNVRIDLSDMVHYHVHHGYEMHRVFNLPKVEFCINQTLKKIMDVKVMFYLKDTITHVLIKVNLPNTALYFSLSSLILF